MNILKKLLISLLLIGVSSAASAQNIHLGSFTNFGLSAFKLQYIGAGQVQVHIDPAALYYPDGVDFESNQKLIDDLQQRLPLQAPAHFSLVLNFPARDCQFHPTIENVLSCRTTEGTVRGAGYQPTGGVEISTESIPLRSAFINVTSVKETGISIARETFKLAAYLSMDEEENSVNLGLIKSELEPSRELDL